MTPTHDVITKCTNVNVNVNLACIKCMPRAYRPCKGGTASNTCATSAQTGNVPSRKDANGKKYVWGGVPPVHSQAGWTPPFA